MSSAMIQAARDRDHGIPAQLLRLAVRLLLGVLELALQRGVALDLAVGLEAGAQRTRLADALGVVRRRVASHVFLQVGIGVLIVVERGIRPRPPLVHRADDARGDVLAAMIEHLVHRREREIRMPEPQAMRACRTCVSLTESVERDSLKIRNAFAAFALRGRELPELDVRLANALIGERDALLIAQRGAEGARLLELGDRAVVVAHQP